MFKENKNSNIERLEFNLGIARTEDIPEIESIRHKVWKSTYPFLAPDYITVEDVDKAFSPNMREKSIKRGEEATKDPSCRIGVARVDGAIAGFSIARKYSDSEAELLSLYVLDEFQGNGIGKSLLHDALTWAEPEKRRIKLYVVEGNETAIGLYNSFGFDVLRKMPPEVPEPPLKYIPHLEMIRKPGELS